MNGSDIEKLYKGQSKLGERMAVVETEVGYIRTDIKDVKTDIKCLDKKMVKNMVNDTKVKMKVSLGQWVAGIIIVALVTGAVTVVVKYISAFIR